MGREQVYVTQRGRNIYDAFRAAQEDAEDEHGHEQGYSGHINVASLRGDYTAAYNAAKKKGAAALKQLLNEWDDKADNDVFGVELEAPKPNKHKVKSKVTITPQKGAKKWVTKYVATRGFSGEFVASELTQGACVKKAREYAEKHQCRVTISIAKDLAKGSSHIGEVEYKPAKGEALGKYLFIGNARS